jgi:type VI secretion system protein ImpK
MISDQTVTLLRATVLHAALLRSGAKPPAIHVWRARCAALVETLQQDMKDGGYASRDIAEASLAQCVLLDELTLRALPPAQQDEWLRETLQARFHGLHDGALNVRERIDAVLRGDRHNRGALEFYGVLLEMGFDGGLRDANVCCERVVSALKRSECVAALEPSTPNTESGGATIASNSRGDSVPRQRTRWIAAGVVVAAAILSLWMAFDRSLNAAIGRLPQTHISQVALVPDGHS